ncbi:hypothetical protein GCM10027034_35210 [Ramlibacter solisilvae]|nr:hypothetical protein [Ramlibacter tataouinensis]
MKARWLWVAALLACCAAGRAAASDEEALSSRGVAGEIMDRAVEHCRRGERDQAMAMFEAIRVQLDPPPALLRLVQDLEASGCVTLPVASGSAFRVQVGGGWDSNVSQGITAHSLVIGSGENKVEVDLDPSYRPRSSTFVQAAADYSVALPRWDTGLLFSLAQRSNLQEPAFDVRAFSAAAAREFRILPWGTMRGQLEAQEIWLGSRHYQRNAVAALQWLYAYGQGGFWQATLNATSAHYFTQASQNAYLLEAGLLREWRVNAWQYLEAGVSLLRDTARGARPGGDRLGWQVQLGAVALAGQWRFKPQLSYYDWSSDELFAPGLLDMRRHNRLSQASLQAERPVWTNTSLLLEWRGRRARDTIALYTYNAQVLSATLALRF